MIKWYYNTKENVVTSTDNRCYYIDCFGNLRSCLMCQAETKYDVECESKERAFAHMLVEFENQKERELELLRTELVETENEYLKAKLKLRKDIGKSK